MRRQNILGIALSGAMILSIAGCSGATSEDVKATTGMEVASTVAVTLPEETTEEVTEAEKLYSDDMRDISPMELVKEMNIGWNLGNVLDSSGFDYPVDSKPQMFETGWGAQYTSQIQMDTVLDKGFDVVRIPVSWSEHIHDDGNYTIESTWLDRVQEVVDYSYKKGAYVILNTHHETFYKTFDENAEESKKAISAIWKQIGERFADYGDHLIFEGLNEPRKVGTSVEWTGDDEARKVINEYAQTFVDTIRSLGGKNQTRCLMITGYAASSSRGNLAAIQLPKDDHLIVSVHAYIPYNFALNKKGSADWGNATGDIDELMKCIDELFISKGVPVIIGEFGAMNKENDDQRIAWADYYIKAANKVGAVCVWWDNHSFRGEGENFGLLECYGMNITWKYEQLVDTLIKAARE